MALGKIKADTLEHSTAGSLDTSYVVNGTKWRINWNGSTNAINGSFNNSSLTDNGTGDFTTAYTNSMADKAYSPTGQAHMFNDAGNNNSGTKVMRQGGESLLASSLRIAVTNSSWSTLGDRVSISWTLAGDLA
jgi:hypothetical protein